MSSKPLRSSISNLEALNEDREIGDRNLAGRNSGSKSVQTDEEHLNYNSGDDEIIDPMGISHIPSKELKSVRPDNSFLSTAFFKSSRFLTSLKEVGHKRSKSKGSNPGLMKGASKSIVKRSSEFGGLKNVVLKDFASVVTHVLRLKKVQMHVLRAKEKFLELRNKNTILEGHPNFPLSYAFNASLPFLLSNSLFDKSELIFSKAKKDVYEKDLKFEFPSSGNSKLGTPKHSLQKFWMKVYAPRVFRQLRRIFCLTDEEFIHSICNSGPWKEVSSSKTSGTFRFLTSDGRLYLKSVKKSELIFLQNVFLEKYSRYCEAKKDTYLVKIFGIFKAKVKELKGNSSVYFIVMENVFYSGKPNLQIHHKYELKGFFQGRSLPSQDVLLKLSPIMKDTEFISHKITLDLGDIQDPALNQIVGDSMFLRDLKVMNYSLILGIWDRLEEEVRLEEDHKWLEIYTKTPLLPYDAFKVVSHRIWTNGGKTSVPHAAADFSNIKVTNCIQSPDQRFYYFIKIIGIYKSPESLKSLESTSKGLIFNSDTISTITSAQYNSMFCKFVSQVILGHIIQDETSNELGTTQKLAFSMIKPALSQNIVDPLSTTMGRQISRISTSSNYKSGFSNFFQVSYFVLKQLRIEKLILKAKKRFLKLGKSFISHEHPKYLISRLILLAIPSLLNRDSSDQNDLLLTFSPQGSHETPSHEFEEFIASTIFHSDFKRLREKFGYSSPIFLRSFTRDSQLCDVKLGSSSGEMLFQTMDRRFFIKTLRKGEVSLIHRGFLQRYFEYVDENDSTFLVRLLCLFRIKTHQISSNYIYVVIMENIFGSTSDLQLHQKFSLKGTSSGRRISTAHKSKLLAPVLKDTEFREWKYNSSPSLHFSSIQTQFSKDLKFLQGVNSVNYSVLIGIHDRKLQSKIDSENDHWAHAYERCSILPFLRLKQAINGLTGFDSSGYLKLVQKNIQIDLQRREGSELSELILELPCSRYVLSENSQFVYFIGITDIFQNFDVLKAFESSHLGISGDRSALTSVNHYSHRLLSLFFEYNFDELESSPVSSKATDYQQDIGRAIPKNSRPKGRSQSRQRQYLSDVIDDEKEDKKSRSRIESTSLAFPELGNSFQIPKRMSFNEVVELVLHRVRVSKRIDIAKNKFLSRKKRCVDENHSKYVFVSTFCLSLPTILRSHKRLAENEITSRDAKFAEDDFLEEEKVSFPPQGSESTPEHPFFKFSVTSYAPKVFFTLRSLYGILEEELLASFDKSSSVMDFLTNSKSGELFLFSSDKKFMLKTLKKSEITLIQKHFLKGYLDHFIKFPKTFLCKILGCYRLKIASTEYQFIIMANVFKTNLTLHNKFDLKGSTVGRNVSQKTLRTKLSPVKKDLEFDSENIFLNFGDQKSEISSQIVSDSLFLESLNVMDYSMLVGIHDRYLQKKWDDSVMCWKNFYKEAPLSPLKLLERFVDYGGYPPDVEMPLDSIEYQRDLRDFDERRVPMISDADVGHGIISSDRRYVYYMGIIDIFQTYDAKKALEHSVKGLTNDKAMISAVPAKDYARRLCKFFSKFLIENHGRFKVKGHYENMFEVAEEVVRLQKIQKCIYSAKHKFLKKLTIPNVRKSIQLLKVSTAIEIGLPCLFSEAGIRKSMSKALDYFDEFKLEFPITGSSKTPAHSIGPFHLKLYANSAFVRIRSFFRIKEEEFVASICTRNSLKDIKHVSKNYDYIFKTSDCKYIIRSVKRKELTFLQKTFLNEYISHIHQPRGTLLAKLLGAFKLRFTGELQNKEDVYFVIMENIFSSACGNLDEIYDLKGIQRQMSDRDSRLLCSLMKDLELSKRNPPLVLEIGKQQDKIAEILIKDTEFLQRLNVTDYSMLVGVRDFARRQRIHALDSLWKKYHEQYPFLPFDALNAAVLAERDLKDKGHHPHESDVVNTFTAFSEVDPNLIGDRGYARFDGSQIYYFGLIDFFTPYDMSKQLENGMRGFHNKKDKVHVISVTNPKKYQERFMRAMEVPFQMDIWTHSDEG